VQPKLKRLNLGEGCWNIGLIGSVFLICALVSSPAWTQPNALQFAVYPPNEASKTIMNDYAWKIFASGTIDPDAGTRLANLVNENHIPQNSTIYLHSPGGSLAGGIALGRAIRDNGLNTSIGQVDPTLKYVGSKPGYCYSACATAFLGGEFRYWTDGSVYGVHRFFSKDRSDSDSDTAQIVSAALVEYIRSMGVDTKIFALASQAGRDDLIKPSHDELLKLNVVNDGRKLPNWSIESQAPGVMYLRGQQETDVSLNKFIVGCAAEGPFLVAMFDGGNNIQQTLTFSVNWLFLDHGKMRMDNLLHGKESQNGKIILDYYLTRSILASLSSAHSVGVGLQPSTASPIFAGFNYMPFEEGAKKLPGFLSVCPGGRSR
jgi:hypothetical protein